MAGLEFKNFIGGREVALGGSSFDASSPFYPEYVTRVANANVFDVSAAVSHAKQSQESCRALTFEERFEILRNASKKIKFSRGDLEYIVKMTGMPVTNVKKYAAQISGTLYAVPEMIKNRMGVKWNKLGRQVSPKSGLFNALEPVEGFVYCVTPGNDPRVVAYVSAWLVSLGMPGIFKVSKNDVSTAQKIVSTITNEGFPKNALSVLCWDTSKSAHAELNFRLVDASTVVWAFGDAKTVDHLLRYETKRCGEEEHRIDHFSDKTVLHHASGRACGIVDAEVDADKAASMIMDSAMEWPLGCNSLKALFNVDDAHEELTGRLEGACKRLAKHTGDPMKRATRVGYADPTHLDYVLRRIGELKKMGLIEVRAGGERISQNQATPILAVTRDVNSEFLEIEYPLYIITAKSCASFKEAVEEMNVTAGATKRIAVSVFSKDVRKIMETPLRAHHVKRWRPTTELDILFHEGNDYLHKLTEPQIHRME